MNYTSKYLYKHYYTLCFVLVFLTTTTFAFWVEQRVNRYNKFEICLLPKPYMSTNDIILTNLNFLDEINQS